MTVISGIEGAVDGAAMVRNWSIDYDGSPQEFVDSGTYVAKGRLGGNKDWSGKYEAHGATPIKMPGEALTFIGSIDGDVGANGTAIVDSVDINWDQEAAAIIAHAVNFSGNGALSRAAAVAADAAVAAPPTSLGCIAKLGTVAAAPDWTELTDIRSMSLHFEAANVAYSDSATAGGILRAAGPIDGSCSINVHTDAFSTLIDENAIRGIRLYDTATTYWEILWMIFGGASGLMVDRETHAIVAATLNGNLNYVTPIATVATKGTITKPSTAEWEF